MDHDGMTHGIPRVRGGTAGRVAVMVCVFSIILPACVARDAARGATPELGALTFRSTVLPSGSVQLAHGEYRAPAAPGSASEIVVKLTDNLAFGSLAEKPAGAVVVATSPGGTGTFYELVLLAREPDGWIGTDTILLGDRARVGALTIDADGRIAVDMTVHGPEDPLCCPTRDLTRHFTVRDGRLLEITDGPRLTGTVWQWVRTQYSNDTHAAPSRPRDYTIHFREDGTLEIRADCNSKGGAYSLAGKQLSIQVTHSTMAACGPDSLEDRFVRDLAGVANYFFREADLYLDIKFDTGTMMFSPGEE
jgi:heat shock protein HslJ